MSADCSVMDGIDTDDVRSDSMESNCVYTYHDSPQNLEIKKENLFDCVVLKWNLSSGLGPGQKFRILCWSDENDEKAYYTDGMEYHISKLNVATRYFVCVDVMRGDTKLSTSSDVLEFYTDHFDIELKQISKVTLSTIKLQWSLKWNNTDINLDGRKVFRLYFWSNQADKTCVETHCQSYSINGLTSDSMYSAYVTVVEGSKYLPNVSNTIEFETEPATPTNIQVARYEGSPQDHLLVTFDGKQGENLSYNIILTPVQHDVAPYEPITSKKTKVVIGNLTPGNMYNVTVRAVTNTKTHDSLYSQFSACDRTALLCPDQPILDEPVKSHGSITLSWSELTITPTKYIIQWAENNLRHERYIDGNVFSVTNLKFCSTYTFRVAAINDSGRGPFSSLKTLRTEPPPVKNAVLIRNPRSPQTSFIVKFNDPDSTSKEYRVVASHPNGDEAASTCSQCDMIELNGLKPGCPYKVAVFAVFESLESAPAICSESCNLIQFKGATTEH